jgi:2-(1,2-epoxy-1,2-dihydrophenyl)acetyl-CoA isomerase
VPTVRVESVGPIARITLCRPQVLNAMNVELLESLVLALRQCSSASAVVLTGEGRAFCVGEDLRETLAPVTRGPEELRFAFDKLQSITRIMTSMPCPVVAGVHGFAVGGGVELAMSADLIVSTADAQYRFPEVALGHAVTGAASARLPAAVGLPRAKKLLLTGCWFSGTEALEMGIVAELADDPQARALELATELAQMPRRSLAAAKSGLEMAALPFQEATLRTEIDAALHCFSSDDAARAYEPFQLASQRTPAEQPDGTG